MIAFAVSTECCDGDVFEQNVLGGMDNEQNQQARHDLNTQSEIIFSAIDTLGDSDAIENEKTNAADFLKPMKLLEKIFKLYDANE